MEIQKYGDFSRNLHDHVVSQRLPVNGAIEVTRRCPLKCVHCYNNLPVGHHEAKNSELTYDEYCHVLDQITDAGCLWILFTGGEILVRNDFLEIYTYAKQKGLLITLFTNGILVDEEVADHLVEWRPFSVEVTLYGRTKETYERITGIPGSYDRCMEGIRLLRERDLPLKLKTMAITLNKDEIWDMKKFVEEELRCEFRFDAMINPRIDCSQSPLAVRLKPEEVIALDLKDPKRVAEWKRFAEEFGGPVHTSTNANRLYHCGGGVNTFAIDPSGRLSPCLLSCQNTWDLRQGSFREGWEKFLLNVRQKGITKHTKCLTCGLKAMCGMCPANGELESEDPEIPAGFLCEVAHLRAYTLDLPVAPHGECEYCEGGSKYNDLMRSLDALRDGGDDRESHPPVTSHDPLSVSGQGRRSKEAS
jgi:radical SAM protein with 4Fe4S-binding SPASM domain